MKRYYVNKTAQSNGDHEVHHEDCLHLPELENREYLGRYSSCFGAIVEAKDRYPKANSCKYCSEECYTG